MIIASDSVSSIGKKCQTITGFQEQVKNYNYSKKSPTKEQTKDLNKYFSSKDI